MSSDSFVGKGNNNTNTSGKDLHDGCWTLIGWHSGGVIETI